jgi:chorismate-pyruvate lyase
VSLLIGDPQTYAAEARAGIGRLAELFQDDGLEATPVLPASLPDVFQGLLVHQEHMTLRLARHHGGPVRLHVLANRHTNADYARRILLSTHEPPRFVEFGLVRIALDATPPAARDEIIRGEAPLGDILIRHDVMRRIVVRWLYEFGPQSSIRPLLELDAAAPLYGRVGTIYVAGAPAIELLEVVRA